jgi:DNA-binding transcriptional LysR family regulator
LDIRTLNYFITLVEQGNFTKAAQYLNISQPSLSYAIKKLEEETMTQLLEREKKKVVLTEVGHQFYSATKKFLNHYKILKKELEYIKESGTGTISIGMIESVKNWITQVINAHHEQFINQKFELREVITLKEMVNAIKNRELHLCISNHQLEDDLINCDVLYEEKFILLVNEKYFNNEQRVSIHDIKESPLIITPNKFLTHQNILKVFEAANVTPNIKYEVESFDTACALVEAGLGITFVPASYLHAPNRFNLVQLKISDFIPERKVYILYNKSQTSIKSVNHFIEICKSYAGNLNM